VTSDTPSTFAKIQKLKNSSPLSSRSKPIMPVTTSHPSSALDVLAVAAEANGDIDTTRSSSLSELEDDDDLSDLPPDESTIMPPPFDVDSETETERLHISPQKALESLASVASGLHDAVIDSDALSPRQDEEETPTRFTKDKGTLGKRKRLQPISDTSNVEDDDDEEDEEEEEPSPKRSQTGEPSINLLEEQLANENVVVEMELDLDVDEPIVNGDEINHQHLIEDEIEQPTNSRKSKSSKKGQRKGKTALIVEPETPAEVSDTPAGELEIAEEDIEEEEEDGLSPDEERKHNQHLNSIQN
jgi:hypothetical protein